MTDFILPDIGEGIVECELLEWLVEVGEHIVEDQPVAEVMTDKATVQIPAMYSGVVDKLYYRAGEIAKVHAPLFAMRKDGEEQSAAAQPPQPVTPVQPVQAEPTQQPASPVADSSASSEDFILPDIGEGIVECEVVKWLVDEGESVKEDQPVVEIMTDKAVVEIPAKNDGIITKKYYQEGDIARVHSPLYAISTAGGQQQIVPESSKPEQPVPQGKALASPAVRRLAREANIDIALVPGSGKKGRVLKQDIEQYLSSQTAENVAPVKAPSQPSPVSVPQTTDADKTVPIKGIQAAMARQMQDSVSTIPHFMVADELQLDNLMDLRQRLKPGFEADGVKLSMMPFFIKALSLTLSRYPVLNSRVNADCTELTYLSDHNIGIAVDGKSGLMVPNIKKVQQLNIREIAEELNRLIASAREGRLTSQDLSGGTISISNVGAIGGTVATPIINKPEVAIVALGKTQRLPRFDSNDQVTSVNLMQVSWSADHRVIDGATMVRFNNEWMAYLQDPASMLVQLR